MRTLLGRPVGITGIGSYVPPRVVTNDDFAASLETSDEWIRSRTGIRERHFVEPGVSTSDLALEAARNALAVAGRRPEDVDAILFATITPDTFFPSSANNLQAKLGCRQVLSFDLLGACTGFLYALQAGASMVASGTANCALVVGAEVMSSILNFEDRTTCVLFGDGAGAAVIEPVATGGIRDCLLASDGSLGSILKMPAGGSEMPSSHESVDQRLHYVHMQGQEVFKYAIQYMTETAQKLLAQNDLTADDIAFVGVHQANKRIVDSVLSRVGIPPEKTWCNIDRLGNTTAGTIPLVLDEAWRMGKLHTGDKVMLLTFGAGITWGGVILEWTLPKPSVLDESLLAHAAALAG